MKTKKFGNTLKGEKLEPEARSPKTDEKKPCF
jgi:hypothetical protein